MITMMKQKGNPFVTLAILLVLIVSLVSFSSCHGEKKLRTGDKAPDFQLKGLMGGKYKLSNYKGKLVHVHFWADWCPLCHEEFDKMEIAYKRLKKTYPDFEFLGINVDQPLVHVEEFIKMHNVTFPILLDVGSKVARSYYLKGIPCNFFVGRDGRIENILLGWVDEQYLEKTITRMTPGQGEN